MVRNVILCGNKSLNGYDIPPEAFGNEAKVKKLYEGKPVCLDHALDGKHGSRSVRDTAGIIRNVRLEAGKPRGDIHTEGFEHCGGSVLLALAQHPVPGVGLSHAARYRKSTTGTRVESVEDVLTVDVVLYPATTKHFFEQTGINTMDEFAQKELARLQAERDTLLKDKAEVERQLVELKSEKTSLESELTKTKTDLEAANRKNEEHDARLALEGRRTAAFAAITKAGLDVADKLVCTDTFVESVVSEKDDSKRDALIQDRKVLVEGVTKNRGPASPERGTSKSGDWNPESVTPSFV